MHHQPMPTNKVQIVPKIWDESELATWATPIAGLGKPPGFFSEKEYYAAPVDNLRTYPVYHPDREPPGYRNWLLAQGPQPLIEPEKLETHADWIKAGKRVFEELDTAVMRSDDSAVIEHFSNAAAINAYSDASHDVVTRDGIILDYRWRSEGLKVPQKQPKRGRLWLNDGSCVRLRPERRDHVWAYDFVSCRTHDGRPFRMLTLVDEYTRECLAINVARKLSSDDVLERLSWSFATRGVPDHIRSDNGPEFTAQVVAADHFVADDAQLVRTKIRCRRSTVILAQESNHHLARAEFTRIMMLFGPAVEPAEKNDDGRGIIVFRCRIDIWHVWEAPIVCFPRCDHAVVHLAALGRVEGSQPEIAALFGDRIGQGDDGLRVTHPPTVRGRFWHVRISKRAERGVTPRKNPP